MFKPSSTQMQLPFGDLADLETLPTPPLADLAFDKLPYIPVKAKSSGKPRRSSVNYHIDRINEHLPGGFNILSDYIYSLYGEVENTTLHTYIRGIKASVKRYYGVHYNIELRIKFCVEEFFNSFKHIKLPAFPKPKIIPEQDIGKLIQYSGVKTAAWMKTLYTTGRRVDEVCSIELSSIVPIDSHLAHAKVCAKGGYTETILIPLDLVKENKAIFRGEQYLLETKFKGRYSPQTVGVLISDAAREIIGRPIWPHVFRHCYATYSCYKLPGKLKAIARQGGWKDFNVFMKTYVEQELTNEDFKIMGQASKMAKTIDDLHTLCKKIETDISTLVARNEEELRLFKQAG